MKLASFLCFFIALSACGGAGSSNNGTIPGSNATPSTTPVASDSVQTVTIDSSDGVKLVGSLFETAKPNSPALLLLHQWQSDRHSYDDFAKRMQARGFAVLSIDGRGFGKSTRKADSSIVKAGRSEGDVKAMLGDVGVAFDFLAKQTNVNASKIGIVGASYGSSLALIYAVDNPNVAAVALLSPGLNYFGCMPTEPAVKKFGDRPLFMTASQDDQDSAKAVRNLSDIQNKPSTEEKTYIYSGKEHGTALFELKSPDMGGFNLEDKLEVFFRNAFQFPEPREPIQFSNVRTK